MTSPEEEILSLSDTMTSKLQELLGAGHYCILCGLQEDRIDRSTCLSFSFPILQQP